MPQNDYMKLTVGDRKRIALAQKYIQAALDSKSPASACYALQNAEDLLREVSRGRLWSIVKWW